MKPAPDAMQSLDELATAAIAAKDELGKNRQIMAVLFADLCDSTSYKLMRGDVEGLLKTYRHNAIVATAVTSYGGAIVKYIGDEVMATFAGTTAIDNAVSAAIKIQSDIGILNRKVEGQSDEQITSKIAIHAGQVILVKFPGHDEPDPQGRVVDTAARIMSLCNPGQILCSNEIKEHLTSGVSFSIGYQREVKGIKESLLVFEICTDGREYSSPKRVDHIDLNTQRISTLFVQAVEEELMGRVGNAATRYETIIADDPMHFGANYRLARLGYKFRKELNIEPGRIQTLAENAVQSRPDSGAARAQMVVATWGQLAVARASLEFEAEEEATLIAEARDAMNLARQQADRYGELVSMNVLAWLLSQQFKRTQLSEVYNEAETICRMAESIITDFERKLVPAFLDTYARVLSFNPLNRQSLLQAKELAGRALTLRESSYTYETLAVLAKLLDLN